MTELLFEKMQRIMREQIAPECDGSVTGEIGALLPMSGGAAGFIPGQASHDAPAPAQSCSVAPPTPEGNDMPRGKKKTAITDEVSAPDFERAMEIYQNDVAPANRQQKQAMKEASDAWKELKAEAYVHKSGFQTAMKVSEMEEADQQAWLRSFNGGLAARDVGLHADLVDIAEGADKDEVKPAVPVVEPKRVEMPQVH
jgi:hypothetical protein